MADDHTRNIASHNNYFWWERKFFLGGSKEQIRRSCLRYYACRKMIAVMLDFFARGPLKKSNKQLSFYDPGRRGGSWPPDSLGYVLRSPTVHNPLIFKMACGACC